nr:integrase, catalytic region, zinc finger, CCHC-type, peptidase aspartic, catalytic [Tanacetum cinerariifolium]
ETIAKSTEGTPQFGPERPRVYSDLNSEEKDRYNADIRATNILLQGLPKDIYTLINHYTDAKDIWDNVKMLLERSELTKEDQESQLYDDFKHFRQYKGESIHEYYVRYVMAVKLNRGLRDSNYDQLYAYLKQHETHARENKMIFEHFSQPTVDPLVLLSNVSNPQHYSPSSSASSSTQVPPPLAESSSPAKDLIENLTNTLDLLTQSYKTFLPQTKNQLRTSSNTRNQAIVQDGRVVVQNVQGRLNRGQGMNPRGGNATGYGGAPNRVENDNQGQARPGQARTVKCYNCNGTGHIAQNCTQPKRPQNSKYFKDKMLLMRAQENGVALDAEQLLFLAGGQDNVFDDDVDEQPVQDLALNVDNVFQADDCDAFDSDVDEAPTAQTMFMANLSSAYPVTDEAGPSYDSDILFEVPDYEHYLDAACVHHEGHYVRDNEVPVVHSGASSVSVPTDAFMMIYNNMCESHDPSISNTSRNTVVKNSLTAELATYKEHVELVAIGYKNPLCLTRAKQVQPALYNGYEIIKDNHTPAIVHNSEDTLEIAKITRKKMNDKMNDPECVTRKVKISPHDYSKENLLATFTPQKQLTPEQIFWSNDLMKLKSKALKERTKALTKEVKEMKDVFEELEAEVAQYAVDRKRDAIELKNLLIENDNLIAECLSQEVFCVAPNSELNVARFTKMYVANTTFEARCSALKAELANLRDTNNHDNQKELINHFSKLEGKDNVIRQLKKQHSQLQVTRSDTDRTLRVQTTDSQITKLTDQVTHLQAQNDLFRAENDKIKQHYKELYDSIKITCAKHIEQELTQSIHTFIEDKQNLSRHTSGKKRFHPRPDSPLHLSNEEHVLGYLKFSAKGTKSEVFGMPIPDSLITTEIQQATYYREYLAKVTHHRKYLAGEIGSVRNPPALKPTQPARKPKAPTRPSISISVASTQPAPTSAPAKLPENKRKQATQTTDKPGKAKRIKRSISRKTRRPRSSLKFVGASEAEEVPTEEPQVADEDANYQKAVEESMKDAYALPKGPLPPVVIREPKSGKYQPLPEVPGKGKAKSNNEEESEKVVLGAEEGGQDEDQAGPDPDAQAEDQTGSDPGAQADGQAGSNPDDTSEGQAGSNPNETYKGQAGPDPGDAEAKQLDEGFTATVYPNVQENLKLTIEEPVLLEEPASSSGTLSSLQHLIEILALEINSSATNIRMPTKMQTPKLNQW